MSDELNELPESLRDPKKVLERGLRLDALMTEQGKFEICSQILALQDSLRELCELKALKEKHGKTVEYHRRQPEAWKRAFALVGMEEPHARER